MIEMAQHTQTPDRYKFRRRHDRPLDRIREWWWDRDRRRHIREMERRELRHFLDEDYIVGAFALQLEEIRKLPELSV
jgi:hypothetical protein